MSEETKEPVEETPETAEAAQQAPETQETEKKAKKKEKKEKQVEIKVKNRIDKRTVLTKIMASFLLVLMVLASCSTCIYFVVSNIK